MMLVSRVGSLSVVAPPVGGYSGVVLVGVGAGCGVCTQESCSDTTGIMSRLLLVLGSTPLAGSRTVAVVMVAMRVSMVHI